MSGTDRVDAPTARLGRPIRRSSYGEAGNRWALIIGISRYQHASLNLKYADRDAEALYTLLQTPSAGAFEPDRIVKLVNEGATSAAVRRALGGFLMKAGRDDLMLLYLACHGSPDPRRPAGSLFLLTHDTDPDEIAGTAVRMDEIQSALHERLIAERVVVIADTCHSARLGGGARGSVGGAELVNTYLAEMGKALGGIALLTSAEASQVSLEDERWGGGHGVFTHFLLEGLKGAADGHSQPRDGIVTVGELFEFVRDKVRDATGQAQHPAVGPMSFDCNLPLAITGGQDAREQFDFASDLYALAARLDDAGRFEAAARHFSEAPQRSRAVGMPLATADLENGRALLAAGETERAIRALDAAANAKNAPADAWLLLGVARARLRDTAARNALATFVERAPESDYAAWARDYIRELGEATGGVRRALVIGINHYPNLNFLDLNGCVNDATWMRDLLVERLEFQRENVHLLIDADATSAAICAALTTLAVDSAPGDTVVIHFSGHAVPEPEPGGPKYFGVDRSQALPAQRQHDTYLVTSDVTGQDTGLTGGISARELHDLLNAIPARQKLVVLDTHSNTAFTTLVEQGADYTLLLAAYPGKLAYEHVFEHQGIQAPGGLLSGCLMRVLRRADAADLDYGRLLDETIHEMRQLAFDQVPMLFASRDQLVLSREDVHLKLWQLAQRDNFDGYSSVDMIRSHAELVGRLGIELPAGWTAIGQAYLSMNSHLAARAALERALEEYGRAHARTSLALGEALFFSQEYSVASGHVAAWSQSGADDGDGAALLATLAQLERGTCHALLVGIDTYASDELPRLTGAVNDARTLQAAIAKQLRCPAENITLLLDDQATRAAIFHNFRALAEKARHEPAVFVFAGHGSLDADAAPTIVPWDGRTENILDIHLRELATIAPAQDTNLLAIFDCGFTRSPEKNAPRSRHVQTDARQQPAFRDLSAPAGRLPDRGMADAIPRKEAELQLRVGATTIFPGSFRDAFRGEAPILEGELQRDGEAAAGGYLTQALAAALHATETNERPSYLAWIERAESVAREKPEMTSAYPDDLVLAHHTLRAQARATFRHIDRRPFRRLVSLARTIIERTPQRPELYLDLGLALYVLEEWTKALQTLRTAVNLYDDVTIFEQESKIDPAADEHQRHARYHLGRLLYERKVELGKAVEELRKARDQQPDDARVHYYLGHALRALIERESLAEAREALQVYLDKGAPLGHKEEVRQFVVAASAPAVR